jgi:hypothetical protein
MSLATEFLVCPGFLARDLIMHLSFIPLEQILSLFLYLELMRGAVIASGACKLVSYWYSLRAFNPLPNHVPPLDSVAGFHNARIANFSFHDYD